MDEEYLYQLGILAGTRWAFHNAMPPQLEALKAADGTFDGWDFDPDEIIAAIINECQYLYEFADIGGLGVDEFNDEPDFVEGYAEGCLEVWNVYNRNDKA